MSRADENRSLTAQEVLFRPSGPAFGSNDGAFFVGEDGAERYVKWYAEPAQAICERLANQIYRDLGFSTPESVTFWDGVSSDGRLGRLAIASVRLPVVATLSASTLTPEVAHAILEGFAVDVLTANWDAMGMGLENVAVLQGGQIARMDQGGALLFRARGLRKPLEFLHQVTEIEGFSDPRVNPDYASVFRVAGLASAHDSREIITPCLSRIEELGASGWERYVARHAPDLAPSDRETVNQVLTTRTGLLSHAFNNL